MIRQIDTTHVQYPNSCVMTAYALVADCFTERGVIEPFVQYSLEHAGDYRSHNFGRWCAGLGIADERQRLQAFTTWQICDGRGTLHDNDRWSGYVLKVHQDSPHFAQYRAAFNGGLFRLTLPLEGFLADTLRDREAVAITGCGPHALVIFHDGNTLRVRDPNTAGEPRAISAFHDLPPHWGGQVADSVLYMRNG